MTNVLITTEPHVKTGRVYRSISRQHTLEVEAALRHYCGKLISCKMGAGGSVVQLNEDAPSLIDVQDTPTLEKSEVPSDALSMGSPNMKSKFPSITSPSKLDSKQKEKESAQLSFKVEIAMDIPYLRNLELSRIYLLKVSVESLDLVIEGNFSAMN